MSSYTTTLYEVMKDLADYKPMLPNELIAKTRKKIFNFDYATPTAINEDSFKEWFETAFLSKYATWEIGFDTFELFHLQLFSKCQRVMQTYADRIDNLVKLQGLKDSDYLDVYKGTVNTKDNGTEKVTIDDTNKDKTVHSTLPINMIEASSIGTTTYADDGTRRESTKDQTTNKNSNGTTDTTYNIEKGKRIDSIKTFINLYDKDFKFIYEQLLNEFNYLFLGIL